LFHSIGVNLEHAGTCSLGLFTVGTQMTCMQKRMCSGVLRHWSQSTFGGQDDFARKSIYEKLTKCGNFT